MKVQFNTSLPHYKTISNSTFGKRSGHFEADPLGDGDGYSTYTWVEDPYWHMYLKMNSPKEEFMDVAESFSTFKDQELLSICLDAYEPVIFKFLNKGRKIYDKLIPYIHQVQEHEKDILDKISKLELKLTQDVSNTVKQKNNIQLSVITFLNMPDKELEKTGDNYPIPNGILIYGPSDDKQKFTDWFINSAQKEDKVIVKEFNFDSQDKMSSYKQLVDNIIQYEEAYHCLLGKKTLLKINGMDFILKPTNNKEDLKLQSQFKNFIERCAKKYHTTIVMVSDEENLNNFESSIVADHRFKQVFLSNILSKSDEEKTNINNELKALRKELARIREKQNSAEFRFFH